MLFLLPDVRLPDFLEISARNQSSTIAQSFNLVPVLVVFARDDVEKVADFEGEIAFVAGLGLE